MRLITAVSYIMGLQVFNEPVRTQVGPSCTFEAIYTCGSNKNRDPLVEFNGYKRVTHLSDVVKYLNKKGLANSYQISKTRGMRLLRANERVVIDIWNRDNIDKYRIGRGKNPGHSICGVGMIEVLGKERIVVKNTRGEENGILGYNLVNPKVVKKRFIIKK